MKRAMSSRVARAFAMFGLDAAASAAGPAWCAGVAAELDGALPAGGVALLAGPSGAGKSATLRALARRIRARHARVVVAPALVRSSRPALDLFRCGLGGAMGHLARAGLADAAAMVRRPDQLSHGQRSRLGIALAIARAGRGATVILDEFGSTLDRATAASLSQAVRRWVSDTTLRIVCATAHDDLLEPLSPEVLVELSLGSPPVVHTRDQRRSAA